MRPSTFLLGGVLLFMIIITLFVVFQRPRPVPRWAVYYHGSLPYAEFIAYDLVVFDSDSHPDFAERRADQVILGYLSTSEAEAYREYYPHIAEMDVLLAPESHGLAKEVIDIRKPAWREYFVNTLMPRVLAKGFDGIILDTIDTPLHLEEQHPAQFAGMKQAAIELIKAARAAHPQAKLMLNRGFAILPQVASDIDYALAESILLNYDPVRDSSEFFSTSIYDELVAGLKTAQAQNPALIVVTLDYAPNGKFSIPMVRRAYSIQRRNGFIPYVTSYDLGNRHEEP